MSGLSERHMGVDRFHLDACFLPISAYAEDWLRLGLIFPNSLKTCLPVDSTPRRSWISRSALPRWLRAIARWISDRPSKPWFDRNKKRSRRRTRQVPRFYRDAFLNRYEFLFVCLPLKLQGATGSPIRPVAVVPRA